MDELRPESSQPWWKRSPAIWSRCRAFVAKGYTWIVGHVGVAHVALLISVVSLVPWMGTFYFNFFYRPDDLRAYFRFPNPNEVGTDHLQLNYFFVNRGKEPSAIEDVSVIELAMSSTSTVGGSEQIACEWGLYPPDFMAFRPSELRHVHTTLQSGTDFSFYEPKKLYVDGVESTSSAILIEPGKIRSIGATFQTDIVDRGKFNAVVLCPVVRLFDNLGRPTFVICKGWESSIIHVGAGPAGTLGAPPPGPVQLLPRSPDRIFRTCPVITGN
jgi:hypothetical protein